MSEYATDAPNRKGKIASRYAALESIRSPFLERARRAARVTLPTLLPTPGQTEFSTPYQSFGARVAKNLAAKILLALFPSENPFFRLRLPPSIIKEAEATDGGKEIQSDIESQLSDQEATIQSALDAGGARPSLFLAILHAIVTGNFLLFLKPDNSLQFFPISQYVVRRDLEGNLLEIIVKQDLVRASLPQRVRDLIAADASAPGDEEPAPAARTDTVCLYTHIRLDGEGRIWRQSQEVEGILVPDSNGTYPVGKLPWIVGRWTEVPGEDYGRGLVEEFLGDLNALEGLSKAILEGSLAAARFITFVDEAGTTRIKRVAQANNLDVIPGNSKDVTTLQADKFADFRVALEQLSTIETRLAQAFLLSTSVQRNGERVTAEEIRYLASELESALGGLYSLLSRELQLPLVVCLMLQLQKQGKLQRLPDQSVQIQIITGLDALGRTNDLRRISAFGQEGRAAVGDLNFEQNVDANALLRRIAVATGNDKNGLVLDPAQVQQNMQAQQAQALREKLGGPAIKAGADILKGAPAQPSAPTS